MSRLKPFLDPKSIAVIGASKRVGFPGYAVLNNILQSQFKGEIYPIHPKEGNVLGFKTCPNIKNVPGFVDLAIIVVPAHAVQEVLSDCIDKGIRAVCVISGGFGETGAEGNSLQSKMVELASKNGVRIIGPNCVGIYNVTRGLNLTASTTLHQIHDTIQPGSAALISQSGGYGIVFFCAAIDKGVRFSNFFSIGNKCDVDEIDLMGLLENCPNTKIIMMFIEEIRDLKKFKQVSSRVARFKPIIVAKMGRSMAGKRAVLSHTGGRILPGINYDKIFRECGIIRATSSLEMIDLAKAFSLQPLMKGKRVGIISDSGGLGVESVDACQEFGLRIPRISKTTREILAKYLPSYCAFNNPIDLTMPSPNHAELYVKCVEILLKSGEVDGIILIMTGVGLEFFQAGSEQNLLKLRKFGKPVMAFALGRKKVTEKVRRQLEEGFIPVFSEVRIIAKCMASLSSYAEFLNNLH